MRWVQTFLAVLIAGWGMSCSASDEALTPPAVIHSEVAPDQRDTQLPVYEDNAVRMVAVGYGDATWQSDPGFFVFRKATAGWIRIEKISTRGAAFGRSPSFQEAKDAGTIPPSIGWDFRHLAEQAQVDVPLTSAGFLFFPDKVELDPNEMEYVLRFSSAWNIEGVETVLRFPVDAVNAKRSK
jgi:hypothetical protein